MGLGVSPAPSKADQHRMGPKNVGNSAAGLGGRCEDLARLQQPVSSDPPQPEAGQRRRWDPGAGLPLPLKGSPPRGPFPCVPSTLSPRAGVAAASVSLSGTGTVHPSRKVEQAAAPLLARSQDTPRFLLILPSYAWALSRLASDVNRRFLLQENSQSFGILRYVEPVC